MSEMLQFAFSGITVGIIYGAVALGFTVIYNASHVVNFAQGEFVMLGAMGTALAISFGIPYPVAALLAVLATVFVSLGLYDLAIRPARKAPVFVLIIITIGASILIRGLASIFFGTSFHTLPPLFGDTPIIIGDAALQPQSLAVVGGTLAIVLILRFLMLHTSAGKAIIATSADPMAASLVGINVQSIIRLSFIVSSVIGALAGILVAPIALASYDMGTLLALKGFAAAMLGGMGNPMGAMIGGLIVGLVEAFSAGYFSSEYKDATAFVMIILVLFAFPNGLFGGHGNERV